MRPGREFVGVAGVFCFPGGRVLVLQENENSEVTGKRNGDWGFPGERLEGDETLEDAFRRMIREEAFSNAPDKILRLLESGRREWLGDYEINPNIWGRVFVIKIPYNTLRVQDWLGAADSEVANHRFVLPSSLLDMQTRPGVREVVKDFLSNKREIIRPFLTIGKA